MAFMPKFIDLVKNSTTVQGSGAVTLGAALSGFTGFASACVTGDQFYYCLQGIDKPAEREVGRGTFQSDGTISRDAALGGPLKNFSSGTKTIALVAAGEWYAKLESLANAPASSGGAPTPLFSAAAGSTIAAPIVAITSAGYSVNGVGEARYVQDAAVDAAYVTASPRTSFRCADGRGFKLCNEQRLTVDMFGALATVNDITTRAINDAAFKAACEHRAIAASKFGSEIHVGPFTYYLGVTIEPEGAFRLIGQGSGHINASQAGTAQTRLIFPTDVCPIRIRAGGTDGLGVSAGKIAANDSYVRGICFEQLTMGTSATAYGVHMRGNATFEDCAWVNCPGNGIHIFADSSYTNAATAGFCDEWRVINCFVHSTNGHGIYTGGNEANAGYTIGLTLHQVGGVAIYEASYFANAHYSPQITGYGQVGERGVYHLGRLYQLISTNTALGSTTTPGTNSAVWYDFGVTAGAATPPNFPQWVNGNVYGLRLPFLITNGTAIYSGYQETGINVGVSNGLLVGGTIGGIGTTNRLGTQSELGIVNNRGFASFRSNGGVTTALSAANIGDTERIGLGALDYNNGEDGRRSILTYRVTNTSGGATDYFSFDWINNKDVRWSFGGRVMAQMGGAATLSTYGRSSIQPGYFTALDLALQDPADATNPRIIGMRDAVPSGGNHSQGEFFFNGFNPSNGTLGWSCTASGTPGTWTAVPVAGFGGTFTGNTLFTGSMEIDGALFVAQSSGAYGVRAAVGGGVAYIDNQKPGTGFGYDINYRTGRSHIFQCSTASDLSATVQDVATVNTVGLTVVGKVAASGLVTGSNLSGTNSGDQTIGLTGDVTGSGTGSFAATIGANKVTNAMLVQVATGTFQGRVSAATGNVETLTGTQATSLLDAVTSTAKGLAPASGGGTANFLRADGSWAAPAGGSGTVTSASVTTANGISGTVATASTTPAITLSLGAITPGSVVAVGAVTGSNLSGTNSGDQTISLTGDVTGSGTGSFAATIGANKVTFAKFVAASAASLVGATAAGNFAELTPASARGVLGLAAVATSGSASDLASGTLPVAATAVLTGDVTKAAGASATTIAANGVTFAKFVAASQAAFVGATAAGNFGELTPAAATAQLSAMVGANGTIAGTKGLVPAPVATDNVKLLRGDGTWVAANAGTVTSASVTTANGISGTVATATTTPAITLTLGAITPTSVAATGAITSSGGGVGYATGAGGAVTQITSRTTGVTLSKSSGAITLFSATTTAGQTTTLTVTNSQVAATDTVVVSQKSGTGLYFCAVTAVAAGSFNLSVYTPAAVGTAEAPVLNFAVVKGVNA